jgi:hypothetical protein
VQTVLNRSMNFKAFNEIKQHNLFREVLLGIIPALVGKQNQKQLHIDLMY